MKTGEAPGPTEAQKREIEARLQRDAMEYQAELRKQEASFNERVETLYNWTLASHERMRKTLCVSSSRSFQSFVERTQTSATRAGHLNSDILPLTQIRIMTGHMSACCRAPMILSQDTRQIRYLKVENEIL